jgi:hypothetical protein
MADKPIDLYLNDHMGGAMLGSELAEQIADRNEGTPLGDLMAPVAAEVEEDRQTLDDLMKRLDVGRNPVKQAGGWLAEKWSRVKFSGAGSGDSDHGNFMALETLALGILGKRSLWVALQSIEEQHDAIRDLDLEDLIARADGQHGIVERARIQAAVGVLSG